MSWRPAALDLDLDVKLPLHPGQRFELELALTVERETTVTSIDLRLVGTQSWRSALEPQRYPDLEQQVMGHGVLAPGRHTLTAAFELPADMPPTHQTGEAWARLEAIADISIPWRGDPPPARWALSVWPLPEPVGEPVPAVVRGAYPGAGAGLEISLASSRLVAGQSMAGTCTWFGDHVPSMVELSLTPVIRTGAAADGPFEYDGVARHTIHPPGDGTSVPFSLDIPGTVTPSFATRAHELEWQLVARMDGVTVCIPLVIVSCGTASKQVPHRRATPVHELAKHAFDELAKQRGWREAVIREPGEELAIEHRAESAQLRFSFVDSVEDGPRILARALPRPLGLGLIVTPRVRVRARIAHGMESGVPHWDHAHHVVAHTAAQTVPFLRAVVPTLVETSFALGAVMQWSDTAIVFEQANRNPSVSDLAAAEVALEQVAVAISSAAIAPPPGLAVDLDAWRELARTLGGELVIGDLSIRGSLGQCDVAVALRSVEHPVAIAVQVGPAAVPSDLDLRLERPAADAEREPAAEPIQALVAHWPADFVDLRIRRGVASAVWPIREGRPDAARVRQLARALRALLAALESGAGPYR